MDGRLIRTNCYEAGDYVVPNVLSPRDLVSRPDNMDETVLSSSIRIGKDLNFISHREKTCIWGFRPGPATAKPVCKALKDVLNVVKARREIILFG